MKSYFDFDPTKKCRPPEEIPGFESLLAANQVSRITAGTTDEAGNNVVNLLAKINSQDTAKDFKKQGIDLTGSLAAARGKGQNTLEAFVGLVEKIAATDKDYVKLRKKADGETGADKKATLSAMADILQQKSIGKAVQDRQALMELLALIQQKEKYQDVKGKVNAEKGTEGDTSYNTVASTLDYKTEQLGNQKAFAAIDLLGQIDEPLGRLLDKVNELAEANPKLTIATEAATVALGALAVGAGSSALMNAVTGGGGGASLLSRGAPLLGKAGLVGLAGIAGYGAGSWLSEKMPDQLKDYIGQNIAKDLAFFDNKEAQQSLNINLSIDGKEIANHVNSINGKEARRN